jgi:signal transduction histidine kinase
MRRSEGSWNRRWLLVPLSAAVLAAWFSAFPLTDRHDWADIAIEASYLAAAVAGYAFVARFRQRLLETAWVTFMLSLLLELADEFTLESAFWSEYLTGGLTVGGLLVAGVGFYQAAQRRQRETAERKLAEEALRDARDTAVDTNRALREAISARDEIVSVVSHDFGSPLTVILSYAQMLEDRVEDEEGRRMLAVIGTQARQLAALASNTLLYSRMDSGPLPLRPEPVRLGALLSSIVEGHCGRGRPRIALEVPPGDVEVEADPSRLRQVFDNLLGNAIRHSPEGGTVHVGLRGEADGATLWVADEGPGIAPHDVPRLFQKFSRLDQPLPMPGASAGTGLGLYICRSIVEAHGGRIAVGNGTRGGARFEVWLPALIQSSGC